MTQRLTSGGLPTSAGAWRPQPTSTQAGTAAGSAPALRHMPRGLPDNRLARFPLGRALQDPGHLGQQVRAASRELAQPGHHSGFLVPAQLTPPGVMPGSAGELRDEDTVTTRGDHVGVPGHPARDAPEQGTFRPVRRVSMPASGESTQWSLPSWPGIADARRPVCRRPSVRRIRQGMLREVVMGEWHLAPSSRNSVRRTTRRHGSPRPPVPARSGQADRPHTRRQWEMPTFPEKRAPVHPRCAASPGRLEHVVVGLWSGP